MPSYIPPKRATAYVTYISLVDQANTKLMKAAPTLAAADFRLSIDGGALNALTTTPTNTPAGSVMVKLSLSAAEMTGDVITVVCNDAAGAEWAALTLVLATSANQIDDLATQASIAAIDVATPAEVWAHAPRTLTQTAAQVQATVTGSNLHIIRAVTFTATLTGLSMPSGWDKLYFTIKRSLSHDDTDALVQIVLSNPPLIGDGLLIINQDVAEVGQAAWGTLEIDGDAVTILLADDATAQLSAGDGGPYDLKAIADGASVLLTAGNVTVAGTPTGTV